jgi:uncharacterized protein
MIAESYKRHPFRPVDPRPFHLRLPARIAVFTIYCYKACLRPFLVGSCRYYPTCSDYAVDAFRQRGFMVGLRLTARRLCRCHPLSRGGYDPVPPRSSE